MAVFKLRSGRVLKTRHVNRSLLQTVKRNAIEQFDRDNEAIECPTYTATLLGGAEKAYKYNSRSIKDESVTDSERSAFAEYAMWLTQQGVAWKQPFYELLLYQGVDENPDDDGDWLETCMLFGISEPEGKKERKIHWIENGLVESDRELRHLVAHVANLPGELEAEAQKASDEFRS